MAILFSEQRAFKTNGRSGRRLGKLDNERYVICAADCIGLGCEIEENE